MKNAIKLEAFAAAAEGSTVEIAFIDKNATPNFASLRRGGISPRGLSKCMLLLPSLPQLACAPLSFALPRKGGSPWKCRCVLCQNWHMH
jgi:hypothetical protein